MAQASIEQAPAVVRTECGGGTFTLHSPEPLQAYARCVGEWLEQWARDTPHAPAFAEPAAAGGWTTLSWHELRRRVGAVAQSLLDLRLPAGRPIVVLSDNGLDHLVLLLAGMHIGTAVCSVSSAYCRLAQGDYARIHAILRTLAPSLVYASNAATYASVLRNAGLDAIEVYSEGAPGAASGSLAFAELLSTRETPAVMVAFATITPDTHAKYLLTSGSTGQPKVVVNSQRMLCANQQMLAQGWTLLQGHKPVLLDWLPWSHTFGGNHNVNLVLRSGGTMVIDDGRPMPGLIEKTLAHFREVQPTIHFNVPRGYEMMLPALESDPELARRFFERARYDRFRFYYAGGRDTGIHEKAREHFLAADLMGLRADDVYLDVASYHSPASQIYRELYGCTTYVQDLQYRQGLHGDRIGGSAAAMSVEDGFASAMALHNAFEHFEGEHDSGFIREAARVLRPGGRVCIVPLFMFSRYAIQTDPVELPREGISFDEGAILYAARGWRNRHGRWYDAAHLVSRLLVHVSPLRARVLNLENARDVHPECYAQFALLLEKPAR